METSSLQKEIDRDVERKRKITEAGGEQAFLDQARDEYNKKAQAETARLNSLIQADDNNTASKKKSILDRLFRK